VVALPGWARKDRAMMTENQAAPVVAARRWLGHNAPRDAWTLVDDILWVDLVEAGFRADRTVCFFKLDLDPQVKPPLGWRSIDYVIVGQAMRTGLRDGGLPLVQAAHANSVVVAAFGEGTSRVEIRAVTPARQAASSPRR
jgi:hypothetical protein